MTVAPTYNKQFEPTVTRRHVRAASAAFHYALAARWTTQRARLLNCGVMRLFSSLASP